jgi:hypothetical protein
MAKKYFKNIEEPWWSKRYGDILGRVPDIIDKSRKWNERENTKRQEVMGLIAGNISGTYNQEELGITKRKLESYRKAHGGSFDDTTSDIYQILADSITTQEKKNDDFMRLEGMTDSMQSEITKVISGIDRSGEISTEGVQKIKDLQKKYLDYSSEFKSSHGDRLESKQYQHIGTALDNGERINRFLISSLYDDKKIDEKEFEVFNRSWDEGSTDAIKQYEAKEDALLKGTIGSQVKRLTDAGTRYRQIQKIKKGFVPYKDPDTDMTYYFGQTGFPSAVETALITEEIDLKKEINLLDDAHIKTMGTSFMDKEFPNLFKTTTIPDPDPDPDPDPYIGETPTAGQKVIDQLVASGKVFGEPETIEGDTAEIYNPGNLKFANQKGATGKDDRGFAIFPTPEEGWEALYRQIELDKGRDLTLDKFVNKYAPPSENDTTAYRNFLQKELNVGKNININKLDTQKLAVAIAKQEGYAGEYPELEDDPKPKAEEPKPKAEEPKPKVDDGKPVVPLTSKPFIKAQSNLSSVASDKFSKLSASEKNKYKGSKKEAIQQFVKDKFEKWLRKSGNLRKAKWKTKGKYAVEDFKYFIPTTYEGTTTRLWYPGAFKMPSLKAQPSDLSPLEYYKERMDLFFNPNVVAPDMSDDGYIEFVKDFDAFRKFLQES